MFWCSQFALVAALLVSGPLCHSFAQGPFQTNQPGASLWLDGQAGTASVPLLAGAPVQELGLVAPPGRPYDFGVTTGIPLQTGGSGALIALDGQILHLDTTDPSYHLMHGGHFASAFPGVALIPISTLGVPQRVNAQFAALEPANASGLALSGPITLDPSLTGAVLNLTPLLGDDSFTMVPFHPMGLPFLSFGGSSYDRFFVNSNGSVSFGSGDTDWFPTPAKLVAGPPRLCGLWTDLSPQVGGQITATVIAGIIEITFQDVAVWGTGTPLSTRLSFNLHSGGCSVELGNLPGALNAPSLVGIKSSLGPGIDTGSRNLANYVGGPQQGAQADNAIYQFQWSGVPQGFTRVTFPFSDGSAFLVQ